MVATWNATAFGERALWSEFFRMISGMPDMAVERKEGNRGRLLAVAGKMSNENEWTLGGIHKGDDMALGRPDRSLPLRFVFFLSLPLP